MKKRHISLSLKNIMTAVYPNTQTHLDTPVFITVTVPLRSDCTVSLESEGEFWFWWNMNIWFDNRLFFHVSASFVWVHVNSCCWSVRHKQLKTEKGWPIPFSFKNNKNEPCIHLFVRVLSKSVVFNVVIRSDGTPAPDVCVWMWTFCHMLKEDIINHNWLWQY